MKKPNLIGLMTLVMISTACGKSGQLTTKQNVVVPPGAKNQDHRIVKPADATSGKLLPFSGSDMSELQNNLLYTNTETSDVPGNKISTIGSPEFLVNGEVQTPGDQQGFVKKSNLVFRAIERVYPDAAGIQAVKSFKLVLRGVRVYNKPGVELTDTLKSQVLCIVNVDPTKEICAGAQIDLTNDTNVNPLLKNVSVVSTAANPFLAKADFQSIYDLKENGEKVFGFKEKMVTTDNSSSTASSDTANALASPAVTKPVIPAKRGKVKPVAVKANVVVVPALEIDLAAVFGVKDNLAQWILENSTVYDSTGNYRKFRFQMGNNIYAQEGELVYQETLVKPATVVEAAGAPKNGETDLNKDSDYTTGIVVPDASIGKSIKSEGIADDDLAFDTGSGSTTLKIADGSESGLKSLAALLVQYQDSIFKIRVISNMDLGADKKASQDIATNRANLIKKALSDFSVKADSIDAKGQVRSTKTTCAVENGLPKNTECQTDRETYIVIDLVTTLTKDKATSVSSDLDLGIKKAFQSANRPSLPLNDITAQVPDKIAVGTPVTPPAASAPAPAATGATTSANTPAAAPVAAPAPVTNYTDYQPQ